MAVGKKIAQRTRPTNLVRGTLVVEVEDFVWQRQLNTLRHFLLRNLHKELGEPLVTEIDFRPMPRRLAPQRAETARPVRVIDGIRRPGVGTAIPTVQEEGNGVKISEQDVRRVADLANLALREDEVARMAHDLDGILSHIDKLNELDTANVEPMAQVLFDAEETATLREDRERPSLTNAEAVANAPVTSGGYYKVPRVIER